MLLTYGFLSIDGPVDIAGSTSDVMPGWFEDWSPWVLNTDDAPFADLGEDQQPKLQAEPDLWAANPTWWDGSFEAWATTDDTGSLFTELALVDPVLDEAPETLAAWFDGSAESSQNYDDSPLLAEFASDFANDDAPDQWLDGGETALNFDDWLQDTILAAIDQPYDDTTDVLWPDGYAERSQNADDGIYEDASDFANDEVSEVVGWDATFDSPDDSIFPDLVADQPADEYTDYSVFDWDGVVVAADDDGSVYIELGNADFANDCCPDVVSFASLYDADSPDDSGALFVDFIDDSVSVEDAPDVTAIWPGWYDGSIEALSVSVEPAQDLVPDVSGGGGGWGDVNTGTSARKRHVKKYKSFTELAHELRAELMAEALVEDFPRSKPRQSIQAQPDDAEDLLIADYLARFRSTIAALQYLMKRGK